MLRNGGKLNAKVAEGWVSEQIDRRVPAALSDFLAQNGYGALHQTVAPWCSRTMISGEYSTAAQLGWRDQAVQTDHFGSEVAQLRPCASLSVFGLS